jgi:ubiquinone/menaquinone biosynthesis C-methylase UbiE
MSTLYTIISWISIVLIIITLYVLVVIRLIRRYFNFPVPSFLTPLIDNPVRRWMQPPDTVIDHVDIRPGMHIMELGPGNGTFTIPASRRTGPFGRVYAVDIQHNILCRLNKRLTRQSVKTVIPLTASAYHLPFPDNTFDRVFMVTVLAEIPDKEKALYEVHRVLKDDGLLTIAEFLPDPDYPLKKTVITWCTKSGYHLKTTYTSILHYVLTFCKSTSALTETFIYY